jgi:hypothetical protein
MKMAFSVKASAHGPAPRDHDQAESNLFPLAGRLNMAGRVD